MSCLGSESYRADRVSNDDDELLSGYALISKHIAPYADVLLCETMSREQGARGPIRRRGRQ